MAKRKIRKSPQNSRKLHARVNFTLWIVGVALMAALIFNLFPTLLIKQESAESILVKKMAYKTVTEEIAKYEEMTGKYPGYRDAYIKLAILNWKINKNNEAKNSLNMALRIDPNNEVARKLEKFLISNY